MSLSEPFFPEPPALGTKVACAFVAGITGGLTAAGYERSRDWLDAGRRVSLSEFGEWFFFGYGAIGAGAVTLVLLHIVRFHVGGWGWIFPLLVMSVVVGVVSAPVLLMCFSMTFLTMPRVMFDLFTD